MSSGLCERDRLREKFVDFARSGDDTVRAELVERNMGLAEHLAKRFTHRGETYDDLVQVASLALINAVDRFDPSLGVEFSTYATRTIIGELKRHFRDKGWAVRAPRRLQELYLELNNAIDRLSQQFGRSPSIRELAAETGATEEAVIEAMEAGQGYRATSLESPARDGDDFDSRLGVDDSEIGNAEWRAVLAPHLASLPERDRLVLKLRFVDGLMQSEIANCIGVSQMQVSRLLTRSIEVLRKHCGADIS
jgi:RNA polymerase sigma-B factor